MRKCPTGLAGFATLAAAALVLAGCASGSADERAVEEARPPVAAAALAYEVPMSRLTPRDREEVRYVLDARLARAGRGATALLGYDSPTITTYLLDIDDRQLLLGGVGGFGYGYGSFGYGVGGYHGSRVYDRVDRRTRSVTTFTRTRPGGELN